MDLIVWGSAQHQLAALALTQRNALWVVVLAALGAVVGVLLLIAMIRKLLYIARPNEALIFSGKSYIAADGTKLGYRIVTGGARAYRIPILEQVHRMDMTLIPIDIVVQNAYSRGNIPLDIHAIANVKVHSKEAYIRNAVERFLGRSRREIEIVAQQTLEGALREVLALMTPEEVNDDRLKFAQNLIHSAEDDLNKLGLALDTLKVQNVSDQKGYMEKLGAKRIAEAVMEAKNAENQVMQEITQAQAQATQLSEEARADAQKAIVQKQNELRQITAELEGNAQAIEREATAAAKTARATAEKELQAVRAELEKLRLQAEVVIPAELKREAESVHAVGLAAPTAENGAAVAQVLKMMTEAWQEMGPQAQEIYIIQHLEEIVGTVVKNLDSVDVKEVTVLDQGDGSGLSSYAATYPKMVSEVLRSLKDSLGVDIPQILSGSTKAQGSTSTTLHGGA